MSSERSAKDLDDAEAVEATPKAGGSERPGAMLGAASASLGSAVIMRKLAARQERRAATPDDKAIQRKETAGAQDQDHDKEQEEEAEEKADPAKVLATARALHDQITTSIGNEDALDEGLPEQRDSKNVKKADNHGPAKDLRVSTALKKQLKATKKAYSVAKGHPTLKYVKKYKTAVDKLKTAYLESPLYSSDDLTIRGGKDWEPIPKQAELLTTVEEDTLKELQKNNHLVKFVVPVKPKAHVVIVGYGASHVDMAQGPVVTAGLLHFDFDNRQNGHPTVGELENTSGGFRPGPLRNATAVAAIEAAGYAITKVDDNKSGAYRDSSMNKNGKVRADLVTADEKNLGKPKKP